MENMLGHRTQEPYHGLVPVWFVDAFSLVTAELIALQDRILMVVRIIRKLYVRMLRCSITDTPPQNATGSGTSLGPCSRCAREGSLLL